MDDRNQHKAEALAQVKATYQVLVQPHQEEAAQEHLAIVNEAYETFIQSHLHYVASLDSEKRDAEATHHEEVTQQVERLRVDVHTYCFPPKGPAFSKASSRTSTSSKRAAALAVKARLEVEAKMLAERQRLERQEQQLKQAREELELKTKLAQTEAEAKALAELEEDETHSSGEDEVIIQPRPTNKVRPPSHASGASSSSMGELFDQQQKLISILSAPPVEIPSFDGNPLQYYPFIRAFEENVVKVVADEGSRLARLAKYCTGKAGALVQGCLIMDSREGYSRAMELLRERFGNPFTISHAWVDKVTSSSIIKFNDGLAIRQLADDLRVCHITLAAIGALGEINSLTSLQRIIQRLPTHLQNRWRREVMSVKRSGRLPNIEDIVKFVESSAEEINDPVFGMKPAEKPSSHQPKRDVASFNADAQPSEQSHPCPVCKSSAHKINGCDAFKQKTVDQREKYARENYLCFNCLGSNHSVRNCKCNRGCRVCGKRHNTLLHRFGNSAVKPPVVQPIPAVGEQHSSASSGFIGNEHVKRVALPVTAVTIRSASGSREITTYALLDPGSSASFCSDKLLKLLGISGQKTSLSLTTVDRANSVQTAEVVSLEVGDIYGHNSVHMPAVYARSVLPINADNIPTCADISSYSHLRGIELPTADISEVLLLIGQDTPEILIPREIIKGSKGEPFATRSLLGWTLNGPLRGKGATRITSGFISADADLSKQVEQFWKWDMHTLEDGGAPTSISDVKVSKLWETKTKHEDGHYVMPIPFKDDTPQLPASSKVAEFRLSCLQKKLERNASLKQKYTEGMAELINKGYAVAVTNLSREDGKVFHLPHHPVINPNKEKIRIVFDCAAKVHGKSLNSQIYQGPDVTNKLIGVLLRFRQHPVALMADIEAMFHQVIVSEDDQDVLRFLWWPGGDTSQQPQVFRFTRHLFGGTWSPSCCATALQRTALDFGAEYAELTRSYVKDAFYVDDLLASVSDVQTATTLAQQLRDLLSKAGFNLTKWVSSHPETLKNIPEEHLSKKLKNLDLDATSVVERALGVMWDIQHDQLTYNVANDTKASTKREVLSVLSSVYDPLGLISPFVLRAKLIFQDLCRQRLGWDDPMSSQSIHQWNVWVQELQQVKNVKIPRCFSSDIVPLEYQLHHFADGSTKGYGVTSYILMRGSDLSVSRIIMAKARLAPIKTATIPRLELMAATLAAKQDELLKRELNVPLMQSQFWSDSMIVLQYITSDDKRFHTFVANRVATIRSLTDPSQWHHVPTNLNPADHASRGISAHHLISSEWLNGPAFLISNHDLQNWPPFKGASPLDDDPEVKSSNHQAFAINAEVNHHDSPTARLVHHYSDWSKLLTAVSWILAIKDVLTKRSAPTQVIDCDRYKLAERAIIGFVQQEVYKGAFIELQTKGSINKHDKLAPLKPFVKDGVLQVGGRLAKSPISDSIRHPIILPGDHHVTSLIIQDIHKRTGHSGREHVLAASRESYWIIGGRRAIRRQLGTCVTCKKRDAPVQQQQMADLPEDRVTPGSPPFSNVGVDMYGPIIVKQGRGRAKRYGCLFTCLTTRAIHVEVAHSLDSDSFIQCLQRFISRRGSVKLLRSDQGRNFVGADKELRREIRQWNEKHVQDFLNKENIKWIFNAPYASHHGGVWERQIRTVRKVVAGLCKEQVLNDESLVTLLCLAENIINNRPITAVSTDPADLCPLTPNHLLLLRSAEVPPGIVSKEDHYSRKRWRQVNYLADIFWKRWVREYLPELQRRSKWTSEKRGLKKGDLVLLVDLAIPRNEWKLGRVLEDSSRSVKVKTISGTVVRPLNKVCLLEADIQCDTKDVSAASREE